MLSLSLGVGQDDGALSAYGDGIKGVFSGGRGLGDDGASQCLTPLNYIMTVKSVTL